MRSRHMLVILVMLAAAAGLEHARGDVDKVPPSQPLNQLTTTLGAYRSEDIPLSDETLETLGKGIFLNRVYTPSAAAVNANPAAAKDETAPVSLFIGYFPTQRTGQAIHSPQHCLPGAGWVFDSSGLIDLEEREGRKNQVGEYLISNGPSKAEVLYWYRSHGRTMASDWTAKLYTLTDSIVYSRTDAALIRIVTPVEPNEDRASAHRRAVDFANRLTPLLPAYVPD